jgi:hypothetical protein
MCLHLNVIQRCLKRLSVLRCTTELSTPVSPQLSTVGAQICVLGQSGLTRLGPSRLIAGFSAAAKNRRKIRELCRDAQPLRRNDGAPGR